MQHYFPAFHPQMHTNFYKKITIFTSITALVAIAGFFVFTSFVKATTIGTNISTTGTLSVNNNADFTLGASNRILIDAAATDTTLTTGVLDLNVDIAADNAAALTLDLTSQGQYGMRGTFTTLTTGQAVTNKQAIGHAVVIAGINDASSSGSYSGFFTRAEGSSNNAIRYTGFEVGFHGGAGTSIDMTGTGDVEGFRAQLNKSAGSGEVKGITLDINSTGTSSAILIGQLMTLDASGASTTSANGIEISEDGSSGTIGNAILIYSNNSGSDGITDAIDASDAEITNAINIGTNTILASGPFSIDLLSASPDLLTITNSNSGASAIAAVAIEGGLTIGNNGTSPGSAIAKHLTVTITNLISASIPAGTCGDYGTFARSGALAPGGGTIIDTVVATPDVTSSSSGIEESNLSWNAFITSNDNGVIRACNPTGSAINTADDQEWRVDIWQH